MSTKGRPALALIAGLAAAAPVALWLLARRRPKRRDAIVDAYKQHIQALVARLRNLIADEDKPPTPPQTPPQTPRKLAQDPEEAYAFKYRLDLDGDNITLAAEALAWVQCRRAVADACASHHLKEITCGTIVYDDTIAPTSAAPCVARFLHGLAAVDNVEILVKALAAARSHVDAQRPRRSLIATLAKGEEVFDVALAKDAKVAFDDGSIFLSAKKKKKRVCFVSRRERPATRAAGFTCRREAPGRRFGHIVSEAVAMYSTGARLWNNNAGHRQARRRRYFGGGGPRAAVVEVRGGMRRPISTRRRADVASMAWRLTRVAPDHNRVAGQGRARRAE